MKKSNLMITLIDLCCVAQFVCVCDDYMLVNKRRRIKATGKSVEHIVRVLKIWREGFFFLLWSESIYDDVMVLCTI